jgi:ABC-2 type transport system ATP-binding protein
MSSLNQSPAMNDIVIQAEALSFAYPANPALQDIQLTVIAGEIFGLVGADGAGKSTLLQLAAGQLDPGSGSIRILNQTATDPVLRDDIAYMPQGFGLYPDLSVQENLEFFSDLHGLSAQQSQTRIRDLLQRTGLTGFEQRRGGNLSGGMMQKLALACALVHRPRVMFLDEPTTGVDPLSRRAFWRLLDGVRAEGVAILYATANMDEAERCDRVAMLQEGELARQGTPLELVANDQIQLISVTGPNVRRYRQAIRELPGVQLAFPVGLSLNVWLARQFTLQDFQQTLSPLSGQLAAELKTPTLHEAALRDLAMSQQEHHQHAGA